MGGRGSSRRWLAVVAAAGVAAGGVTPAAGAAGSQGGVKGAPPAKAVLNVNDGNPIGKVGDSQLSLDEAIRLSNGSLDLASLSAAERAQVKGTPGARSPDRIELAAGATVTVPQGQSVSALVGNDGDTLDGNGATLKSGAEKKGVGLVVSSSDFTLTELQVRDFETSVRVDFGGRNLKNIKLEKLQLFAILTASALSSNGSLRGLSVTDNVFDGLKDGNLVFIGSAAPSPGSPAVANTLLENVEIARNHFKDGSHGLYLHATLNGVNTTNATTRNVSVTDNRFTRQANSPLNIAGALPSIGATHSNVTLENILVARNRIQATSWGIWMGHETFGLGVARSTVTKSLMRNITVRENTIRQGFPGDIMQCIALETAPEFPGELATENRIEDVTIASNDISGCKNPEGLGVGVIVSAGRPSFIRGDATTTATNNSMRNISILNNVISNSDRGIVVGGGYAPRPGVAKGNKLEGLRIQGNVLTNNTAGIRVVGGDGVAQSTVTGNSVTKVTIASNRVEGSKAPCEAVANAGVATGNTLDGTCPR